LVAAMLLFGASMSLFDVAINTEGSELESLGRRPVMSNFHGMFSVGGVLGAGLKFGPLHMRVEPRTQLCIVGGCLAIVALAASRAMLETHASTDSDATHFATPKGV